VLSITGGNSVATTFDENSAGTPRTNSGPGAFVSPFDPATGRTLIAHSFFVGAVIYLYDTGKGFIIDVTPSSQAGGCHAFSGPLIPQSAGPFSIATHLSGNLIALGGGSSSPSIPSVDFAANFDSTISPGTYNFLIDLASSNSTIGSGGQVAGVSLTDHYLIDDANTGHGVIRMIGGIIGDPNTFAADLANYYIIGPNQFVAIGQTMGVPSGVLFFDPQ
jgi:hypothetical protein